MSGIPLCTMVHPTSSEMDIIHTEMFETFLMLFIVGESIWNKRPSQRGKAEMAENLLLFCESVLFYQLLIWEGSIGKIFNNNLLYYSIPTL